MEFHVIRLFLSLYNTSAGSTHTKKNVTFLNVKIYHSKLEFNVDFKYVPIFLRSSTTFGILAF